MKNEEIVFWKEVDKKLEEKERKRPWLAAQTGISLGRINNWYVRGTLPRVEDAVAIAEVLGVPVAQLVTGERDTSGIPLDDLDESTKHLVKQWLEMDDQDRLRVTAIVKAILTLMSQGILDMPLNAYLKMMKSGGETPS